MQGQEADVIILSYVLFDPARLQVEPELSHIYNLNRFNVAVTRAKSLCILVANAAVLQSTKAKLELATTRAALSHMQAFQHQAIECVTTERLVHDVPHCVGRS